MSRKSLSEGNLFIAIAPVLILLFFHIRADASTVRLKNGDIITGKILKSDGKTVLVKTESAGDVTITLEAVTNLESEQSLYVLTTDGRTLYGPATLSDGTWEIATPDAGTVQFAMAVLASLYDEDTYRSEVERYLRPGWRELWTGVAEIGLSLARGNSETTNFSIGASATRTTKRDKTSVYASSLYASNDTSGESVTTANVIRGGGRYEINVTDHFFSFGFTDLEHDELQQLDLRWVLGGGFGWYAIRTDDTQFQVFGGASYNRESFSTEEIRESGEVLAGQEFNKKINARLTLAEKFVVFPNVSESGEYRLNFDLSLQTTINKWLGWHLTFTDRYLSNPVPGSVNNDIVLTTGARFTFG